MATRGISVGAYRSLASAPHSGPGGRRFKSFRPDQLFYNQQFTGTRIIVERLVPGQEVNGSSAFAPTILSPLKSMRYAAF